ncbi:MAG: adenosylcobinamide-GDP ribazoletransferase [Sphingomonas sp.]
MKGLVLALQFLTRIPMPRIEASADDFAKSMRWFPAAGIGVGLVIAGTGWAGTRLDSWTGALAALVAWVAITGALHLDGLSDLADASGAVHKDRERFLAVMADPHVGSFGAVAIALQLIAKLVLLHALLDAGLFVPLILVPFAARIGPLVWTRWLPPLHAGLAARFASVVRIRDVAGWLALLAASALLAPAILAAPALIAGWWLWLRRRLGGVSGDCHGAGIELVETGSLVALLVASRL